MNPEDQSADQKSACWAVAFELVSLPQSMTPSASGFSKSTVFISSLLGSYTQCSL